MQQHRDQPSNKGQRSRTGTIVAITVSTALVSILVLGVLVLISLPSVLSPWPALWLRSSREFAASLQGQLVLRDGKSEDNTYVIDFSGNRHRTRKVAEPRDGTLSREGEWRLVVCQEEDVNSDGVTDHKDRSVYLPREGEPKSKRVPFGFPAWWCAWGSDHLLAVCTFDASDVVPSPEVIDGTNNVVYLVDFESARLIQRLSDPAESAWIPKVSPDGKMVAFEILADTQKGVETDGFQVVDTRTGELIYELLDSSVAGNLAWSRDSTRIAFVYLHGSSGYSEREVEEFWSDVYHVDLRAKDGTMVNVTQTSRFSKYPGL